MPRSRRRQREEFIQYEDIQYVPAEQDPSIGIETRDLVAKVIGNTGLLVSCPY